MENNVTGNELNATSPDSVPPELRFFRRVERLLNIFAARQTDVLKMSELLTDRELKLEIDDKKRRLTQRIESKLGSVNNELLERMLAIYNEFQAKRRSSNKDERRQLSEEFAERILEDSEGDPRGERLIYLDSIVRSSNVTIGAEHLHSSLLLVLVGEMEMFINQLARACFRLHPDSLRQHGDSMTWAQVSSFDSMDDLRNHIVDETVDKLLHGSLEGWVGFFEKTFGIAEIPAAREFDALETIQRRHCIAHNTGLASKQYLDKLADFNVTVTKGEALPVDAHYLMRAADTMLFIAYSLSWSLAMKLTKEPDLKDGFIGVLAEYTYTLLEERRHGLVDRIGKSTPYSLLKSENAQYSGFMIKVNRWISCKELGQFSEVRREVENLQVQNMSNRYKLAKLALLDQNEEAFELVQKMISHQELSKYSWITWPLLRGVRDYAQSQGVKPIE